MKRFLPYVGAAAIVLCGLQQARAVVIISTFDSSLDGWTVDGGNVAHVPAGGNPGGFLEATDSGPSVMHANAPGAFLGDISSFDGGTLGFDSILLDPTGVTQAEFGRVSISNGALTGTFDLAAANLPAWTSYSTALTAAAWGLSQSDWTTLLSSVTSITVILESTFGQGEVVGFDNFFIENDLQSPVIPEPSSLALLAMGLSGFAGVRFARRKKAEAAR
jgi:hypothetical protein